MLALVPEGAALGPVPGALQLRARLGLLSRTANGQECTA